MTRALLAGIAIVVVWMLVDTAAHRLILEPFYASSPLIWRPASEMSAPLVIVVTTLLSAALVAGYTVFVWPRSFREGCSSAASSAWPSASPPGSGP